ncbi:MAG: tRNA pseudouridine(38-40) synthase TruA [Pseudomonadota bacterium]
MRIALGIEYDGSRYHGWQMQAREVDCVQQRVDRAVSFVAGHPVTVVCAGRTDAGVHATGQVVHFDTEAVREERAWLMGVNSRLPDDIVVRWVRPVADDFHARYSAFARRYRYVILNEPVRPAILGRHVTWNFRPLDAARMHAAAQALIGEHDFSSFRAAGCQSTTPMRHVSQVAVTRHGALVVVEVRANAFLHHMVRNIAGTLMAVGCGQLAPERVGELLAARDRRLAPATAAPYGLYLVQVDYPPHFGIPTPSPGPFFLPVP